MKKFSFLSLATLLLVWPTTSRAELIINVFQSNGDVVMSGRGTLDLTDLAFGRDTTTHASVYASLAEVTFGQDSPTTVEEFSGINGPGSFGSSNGIPADGSGDTFGLVGVADSILVPLNYTSGAFLSGTDTFQGATLTTLGLTNGTYTYTWGTGLDADSLVVNIGPLTSVPEPSSLALCGIAGVVGSVIVQRKRKRFSA